MTELKEKESETLAPAHTAAAPVKQKRGKFPRRRRTQARQEQQALKQALAQKYGDTGKKPRRGFAGPKEDPPRNEGVQAALLNRQNRKTVAYAFHNAIKNSRANAMLMLLICIVLILFVIAMSRQDTGNFTISLNRRDMAKYGLALSDTASFENATGKLKAEPIADATNISITDLPQDVNTGDGNQNGKNYISYTFYIRNAGKQDADYRWAINVLSSSKHVEEAVRVAVYYNDTPRVVYAKWARDGSDEPDTVPFISEDTVQTASVKDLKSGSSDRYTVVIWLEGDDPDCTDDLIGGSIQLGMDLSVDTEPKATQSIFQKLFGF